MLILLALFFLNLLVLSFLANRGAFSSGKPGFDERQQLLRSQGSGVALFALFIWGSTLHLLDRFILPISLHFALFSFYALGLTVFCSFAYWQDAFFNRQLTGRRFLFFFGILALGSLLPFWTGLATYGYDWQLYLLSRDSLPFFMLVFLTFFLVTVWLKNWRE